MLCQVYHFHLWLQSRFHHIIPSLQYHMQEDGKHGLVDMCLRRKWVRYYGRLKLKDLASFISWISQLQYLSLRLEHVVSGIRVLSGTVSDMEVGIKWVEERLEMQFDYIQQFVSLNTDGFPYRLWHRLKPVQLNN